MLSFCCLPPSPAARPRCRIRWHRRIHRPTGWHSKVTAEPAESLVRVTLRVSQSSTLLRELRFTAGDSFSDFSADGELDIQGSDITWRLPERGGVISWRATVSHRRNGNGYDAWLGPDFGLFRAEDIIPRAASRTLKGARSATELSFRLPANWSVVTQYYNDAGRILIDNPERSLDLPSGWIVMGDLGVRREEIAGLKVAVAGPVGHSVRRLDTLALLNWTLPELARMLPELPHRITIISAGDPMWRGGLSAPLSLFTHADRPLISENGTSTLLHEIMHIALGFRTAQGYDWITEGLAEYYGLQMLYRSGTISEGRYADALAHLAGWASEAESLCARSSTGATTALAVGVFAALDTEIRSVSGGEHSLDDIAAELSQVDERVDLGMLRALTEKLIGAKPDTLHSDRLPGCHMMPGDQA